MWQKIITTILVAMAKLFSRRGLPFRSSLAPFPVTCCLLQAGASKIIYDQRGRLSSGRADQSHYVEAYQKGGLRADCHEAFGGAFRVVERERDCRGLRHPGGTAREDSAAAGEVEAAGLATRDEWWIRVGTRSADYLGVRRYQ